MNTTFLTAFAILTGLTASAQNLNDNLLIHYPFDGNANDMSGNGYNGIANATLTADQFGNPNSAYSFNGFNEFVDLPNDPALKPQLPISVSAWIRFDNINAEKTVVFTNNYAMNVHSGVWLNTTSTGYVAINYGRGSGGSGDPDRRTKIGTTALQPGTWYLITGVVRGATDMDIYIDCVNDGGNYAGSSIDPIGYTSDPGSIGRKDVAAVNPYYFEGALNDFRYWDRALIQADIDALCQVFANTPEQSLKDKHFTIYPNPTSGILHIDGQQDQVKGVEIIDQAGRRVRSFNDPSTVDLSDLSPGIYIVQLVGDNATLIQQDRIILE